MPTICVYCGSRDGGSHQYVSETRKLGRLIAEKGYDLVYGGGRIGLMKEVADSVMRAGGRVTGIIPSFLQDREIGHDGITNLIVVDDMHERKAQMIERADAFVALPGGIGTLEEVFEVLAWKYLGLHSKPVALLSVRGFFRPMLRMLNGMTADGFIDHGVSSGILTGRDAHSVMDRIEEALHVDGDQAHP